MKGIARDGFLNSWEMESAGEVSAISIISYVKILSYFGFFFEYKRNSLSFQEMLCGVLSLNLKFKPNNK